MVTLGRKSVLFSSLVDENDKLCLYPWSGLVVNPDGRITPCCHAPLQTISHISEVESLNDFFNESPKIDTMRKAFKNKIIPCDGCNNRYNAGFTPAFKRKNPNLPFDADNYFDKGKKIIRYLEFTPSNLCNQACAMCGSKYSSMWDSIDKIAIRNDELKFRYNDITNHRTTSVGTYKLSDKDWEKVVKCIEEGVTVLYIKGGEPFADERNIELLERAVKGDFPHLQKISITTNFKRMNKRITNIIRKLKEETKINLGVSISIDGIGKQYEWIRSSPWENLVNNINHIIEEVPSFVYSVGVTQSIYNYFNLPEVFEVVSKLPNVGNIHGQLVTNPNYLCPTFVLPREVILKYNLLHKEKISNNKKYNYNQSNDWVYWDSDQWKSASGKPTWPDEFEQHKKNLKEFTSFMNRIRGFNIEDAVPEFGEYYD